MNKKIIIPTITVAILGAGIVGANLAQADESSSNPHQTVIERLSERFGLNENDVQLVFEELKKEHQADKLKQHTEKLDTYVNERKITPEQKGLIIEKHKEMWLEKKGNFENLNDLNREEKREMFKNHRQDYEEWAEENGIDLQYFHDGKGPRDHHI